MFMSRFSSRILSFLMLLQAFTAGAAPTIYTDEQSYLDALALTVYDTAHEGFEAGEWVNLRSPSSQPV